VHAVVFARCGVWSPSPLFSCAADSCTHNGSEPLEVNELIVDHTPITFPSRLCSRMNIIANPRCAANCRPIPGPLSGALQLRWMLTGKRGFRLSATVGGCQR
jgi:hypothetical protein